MLHLNYRKPVCVVRNLQYICTNFQQIMLNRQTSRIAFMVMTLFLSIAMSAQDKGYDVFNPIAKYMAQGDADRLSAWFADNLEVTIFATANDSSRSQARQIMKSFFKSYTPRSFEVSHTAGRSNMKYALGTLNAGGEMFLVTIFVNFTAGSYKIQQLKIERLD